MTLVSEEVVHMLLAECARQSESSLTQRVEKLAREHDVTFADQSYGLLVKAYSGDPSRVNALPEGLLAREIEVTPDFALSVTPNFALSVIGVCGQTADVSMADKFYEHFQEKKLNVISPSVTRLR